jgi:very-short-patch-repair endonuclease
MEIFNRKSTKEKRGILKKSETVYEKLMWEQLRGHRFLGVKFFRQYGIGEYIVDFYSPMQKLVIEIDGAGHFQEDGIEYDKVRERYFNSLGIKCLRFSNEKVEMDIESVLEKIRFAILKEGK